jgi:(2Fe-2S) ferredoxin
VAGRLRLEVIRRGLDAEILVNNCGTIDLCDIGPNLVVYPDNIIYRGVTIRDIPAILGHLTGGPPVDQLVLEADSPEEEARRGLYREAISGGPPLPTEQFAEIAVRHGFDDTWIAEQQRRGFIARKPDESGQETIVVTKKARDRYRLLAS